MNDENLQAGMNNEEILRNMIEDEDEYDDENDDKRIRERG